MSAALSRVEVSQVAVPAPDTTRAFEPRGIDEAFELAKVLVASRLLPRSVATPEAAFAIIATGRELGLTAMQSLRSIHVIEGKPTLSADLIAALVKQRADVCLFFRLVESTDHVATYDTQRRGEPSPTRMSFSMTDANRAGVTGKDNWRKYPAAMLRARCITALARAVYPDLAMGLYDPDEVAVDVPAPADYTVTPEPAKSAAPQAAPAPAVDAAEVYEAICTRLDAAENLRGINAAAAYAKKQHDAGVLSAEQLEQIGAAYKRRREDIAQQTPPAAVVLGAEREPGEEG